MLGEPGDDSMKLVMIVSAPQSQPEAAENIEIWNGKEKEIQNKLNCGILPSRMGEHGLSLESMESMKSMENIEKMGYINQTELKFVATVMTSGRVKFLPAV